MATRQREDGRKSGAASLAVFGKHPAWNDHMDDLGLETEVLVRAKQQLYLRGIGGVVDRGDWESLEPARRIEGFAHAFLWRWLDGVVIGRMWSSADGLGRSAYPMVACAEAPTAPFAFLTDEVLPRLRELEAACKAARSRAEVERAVAAARRDVRGLAAGVPAVSAEPRAGPGVLAELADHPAMGTDHIGVPRVLYEIAERLGEYRVGTRREETRFWRTAGEASAHHMRVPRLTSSISRDWDVWLRLLSRELDRRTPIFMASADDADWTDLVVGVTPSASEMLCLRTTPEDTPPVTEVPYEIEPTFCDRVEEEIKAARAAEQGEVDPGWVPGAASRKAAAASLARGHETGRGKLLFVIGVGAAAAVLIAVVIFVIGRLV